MIVHSQPCRYWSSCPVIKESIEISGKQTPGCQPSMCKQVSRDGTEHDVLNCKKPLAGKFWQSKQLVVRAAE